jgi:hypothetical protein
MSESRVLTQLLREQGDSLTAGEREALIAAAELMNAVPEQDLFSARAFVALEDGCSEFVVWFQPKSGNLAGTTGVTASDLDDVRDMTLVGARQLSGEGDGIVAARVCTNTRDGLMALRALARSVGCVAWIAAYEGRYKQLWDTGGCV